MDWSWQSFHTLRGSFILAGNNEHLSLAPVAPIYFNTLIDLIVFFLFVFKNIEEHNSDKAPSRSKPCSPFKALAELRPWQNQHNQHTYITSTDCIWSRVLWQSPHDRLTRGGTLAPVTRCTYNLQHWPQSSFCSFGISRGKFMLWIIMLKLPISDSLMKISQFTCNDKVSVESSA